MRHDELFVLAAFALVQDNEGNNGKLKTGEPY